VGGPVPAPQAAMAADPAGPGAPPDAGTTGADAEGGGGGSPDAGGKLASRSVGYARSSLGNLPALAAGVNLRQISHLIITFANPTATEPLALSSSDDDVAVLVSAAHAAGTKVLVAIGGSSGTPRVLPQLVPDKVQAFVQTVVAFADARNFDGVDVDVEDAGMPPANYEALVKGLSAALRPKGKLLTAAVASWFDAQITPAALALMDFVSVMAYDGCNSSEAMPCQHSSYESAVQALDHFVKGRKLPADEVVLGVPFYGYCWGSGCGMPALTYADIAARFPGADQADFIDTPDAKVYYNGPATIARKAKLGRMHGGVMFWHLAGDAPAPHSLLDVIGSALKE
jgi:chitinase